LSSILDNINAYCVKNKISIRALEEKAGIGNGTIRGWKESKPNLKSLEKISKATGISVNHFLADQDKAG